MAYASALQKYKNIPKKSTSLIVKHYNAYLKKDDEKHKALTFYRIGALQQNFHPLK